MWSPSREKGENRGAAAPRSRFFGVNNSCESGSPTSRLFLTQVRDLFLLTRNDLAEQIFFESTTAAKANHRHHVCSIPKYALSFFWISVINLFRGSWRGHALGDGTTRAEQLVSSSSCISRILALAGDQSPSTYVGQGRAKIFALLSVVVVCDSFNRVDTRFSSRITQSHDRFRIA